MTDREKLIEIRKSVSCNKDGCRACAYSKHEHCMEELLVDHLIANGVVVREKGEWDDTGRYLFRDGSLAIRCNLCGAALHQEEWDKYNWRFCPNCGADMRKGENDGKTCFNCGTPITKEYCEDFPEICEHWTQKKPQTNADRIRAMSDEKLADFIQHIRTNTLLAEALGVPVSREKDLEFVRQPVKDGDNK